MDYFEKGLALAKEYYAIYKVWDVNTKTMFKDFNLGLWWTSVKKRIAIGSLTDEKVTILKDTNIDFGIVPLYWDEWLKCYKDWTEKNDKIQPLEKELYNETYYIGKWYKRNKKLIESKQDTDTKTYKKLEQELQFNSKNIIELYKKITIEKNKNLLEEKWMTQFNEFKIIWDKILNHTRYEKYDDKIYDWGRKEITQKIQNEKHLEMFNSISMEWNIEKYDQLFWEWTSEENGWKCNISRTWINKYYSFKKAWENVQKDSSTILDNYNIDLYNWGRKQINAGLGVRQRKMLNDINMRWYVDEYECVYSSWRYYLECCKKICENNKNCFREFTIGQLGKIQKWYDYQIAHKLNYWQRKEFDEFQSSYNIEIFKNDIKLSYAETEWKYYFEICKKLSKDKDYKYLKSFSTHELNKIQKWYDYQIGHTLDGWQEKEFNEFQFSSNIKVFEQGLKGLKSMKEVTEKKKNSFSGAIIGEWVMYKKYDAYKDSVIVSKDDADYFEVSMAISNLFSEKEFVEYINKNKMNLVMRARMDIEATQSKNKCEFGYKVKEPPYLEDYDPALKEKYKLNKLVYGLSSHIVTAMFFKG